MLVTSGLLYAIVPEGPPMPCGCYLLVVAAFVINFSGLLVNIDYAGSHDGVQSVFYGQSKTSFAVKFTRKLKTQYRKSSENAV